MMGERKSCRFERSSVTGLEGSLPRTEPCSPIGAYYPTSNSRSCTVKESPSDDETSDAGSVDTDKTYVPYDKSSTQQVPYEDSRAQQCRGYSGCSVKSEVVEDYVPHIFAPHEEGHTKRRCLLWACKACKKGRVSVDRRRAATMRERRRLRKVTATAFVVRLGVQFMTQDAFVCSRAFTAT